MKPRPSALPAARAIPLGDLLLACVCAAVVAFYAWKSQQVVLQFPHADPAREYYNLLARGFARGQLNLDVEAPAGLRALADPYDPAANAAFRQSDYTLDRLHDTSYFNGKIYLYFGAAPAVLLFWPYHALTGGWLTQAEAIAVCASVGFLAGVALLRAVWRRHFPSAPAWALAGCALVLGLANSVATLLARPDVWEVPIAAGYAGVMLMLLCVWRALGTSPPRPAPASAGTWGWIAAASTAGGLAIASRPSLLPVAAVVFFPALKAWWETRPRGGHENSAPRASGASGRSRLWLAALVPLGVIGVALAVYNHARFGDALEFGQRYQLAGDRQGAVRHFSTGYFWFNFRAYFLARVQWGAVFPFLTDIAPQTLPAGHGVVDYPYGILTNTPFALFGAAAVLAPILRRREEGGALAWLVGALLLVFLGGAVLMCFFYGTCTRYQVEFHPALMLLAAVGVGELWAHAGASRITRAAWSAGLAATIVFSAGFGFLKSYQGTGKRLLGHGILARENGDLDRALASFDAAAAAEPELEDPPILAAMLVRQSGRLDDAARRYEDVLRRRPTDLHAHNNLGNTLQALGRFAEAVPHYEASLAINPEIAQTNANLGVCWLNLNQPAKALPPLERAVSLAPNFADYHLDLAIAHKTLGDLPAARASYQRARALNPALPELTW